MPVNTITTHNIATDEATRCLVMVTAAEVYPRKSMLRRRREQAAKTDYVDDLLADNFERMLGKCTFR